jgi:hypothetical protein
MNFEKDMLNELSQVSGLTDKVKMLTAPEGTAQPFVVCAKENVTFKRVLDGRSIATVGIYQITVVAQTYAETQDLQDAIKDKLLSFQGRYIGTNGTGVKDVVVEYLPDQYVYQPEAFTSVIRMTATY